MPKALIVEDSPTQAAHLSVLLEEAGFQVASARNGRLGWEHIQSSAVDIVITDVVMPEMDGYELCRLIKTHDDLKTTPVVLLTTLRDPTDVIRGLECGADNFITKPFEPEFLLSRLRHIELNLQLRQGRVSEMGIEIFFAGRKHAINSDRLQIIDLLLSTYESAIQQNKALERANDELTRVQDELKRKNVQLEELNDTKNTLLGMAAHDLRNPIGVIMSYSRFLRSKYADQFDDRQARFMSSIQSSSEFMLNLIDDLLDISHIESGRLNLTLTKFSFEQLLNRCVELNRVLAERKNITIECDDRGGGLPDIVADAGKIEQVLNNLMSNAVKYSFPDAKVEVAATADGDTVTVSVRDHGQGIAEGKLVRVFQPFEKAGSQATAGEKSTGLGLAIALKIVQGHGGRIWVESELAQGSTFHFTLPFAGPPAT